MSWHELLKNGPVVLALEPEELAGPMLEYLHSLDTNTRRSMLTGTNLGLNIARSASTEVARACMEAWAWLQREGILIPRAADIGSGWEISRRGERLKNQSDVDAYRRNQLLPKAGLHPLIADAAWAPFIRGAYEGAVFGAFKEIEVAVRSAGGFTANDFGTDLMRKAFNIENGPLTRNADPRSERQALSDLFAGAIGSYKNPHSHRKIAIDAQQAAEAIVLASHLLRIVDDRRTARTETTHDPATI